MRKPRYSIKTNIPIQLQKLYTFFKVNHKYSIL